eukprot:1146482-Rhodomonas_salina.3
MIARVRAAHRSMDPQPGGSNQGCAGSDSVLWVDRGLRVDRWRVEGRGSRRTCDDRLDRQHLSVILHRQRQLTVSGQDEGSR